MKLFNFFRQELAIGAEPEEARSLVLFTLGVASPNLDVAAAANLVAEAVKRLASSLPGDLS